MKKYTLTCRNDDEGFLGSDPDAIDTIDFEKTLKAYNREVITHAKKEYPNVELVMEYGSYSGSSFEITCNQRGERDWREMHDIQDNISDMIGRIYEMGNFWVTKK